MSNLTGEDRLEAMKVMDDDAEFDQWMRKFEKKRALQAANAGNNAPRPGGKPKRPRKGNMSKESFLEKFGGYKGGDE